MHYQIREWSIVIFFANTYLICHAMLFQTNEQLNSQYPPSLPLPDPTHPPQKKELSQKVFHFNSPKSHPQNN